MTFIRSRPAYNDTCTGAVLAGGKSSRFGSNKALAIFQGRPLISLIIDPLRTVMDRVLIISNKPAEFEIFGLQVFSDIYVNRGPLAGIHSALKASYSEWTIIAPCDMPFFSSFLAQILLQEKEQADAVCFSLNGRIEPLPLLIHKDTAGFVLSILKAGNFGVYDLLNTCKSKTISVENCGYPLNPKMFRNCNSAADLNRLEKLPGRRSF